jgi:hypothetical protein
VRHPETIHYHEEVVVVVNSGYNHHHPGGQPQQLPHVIALGHPGHGEITLKVLTRAASCTSVSVAIVWNSRIFSMVNHLPSI